MGTPARIARAVLNAQAKLGSTEWTSPTLFVADVFTAAGIVWPGDEYACRKMGWWVKLGDAKIGGPQLGDVLVHVDGLGILEKMDLGWYHLLELPVAPPNRVQRVQRVKYSVISPKLRGFIRPNGFTQ